MNVKNSMVEKLKTLSDVSEKSMASVMELGQLRSFKESEFFLKAGDTPQYFGWVTQGFFRMYYVDREEKEWVKAFLQPNEICGPYAELLTNRPSRTFIQATTDSEMIVFDWKKVMELADQNLELQKLTRIVAEQAFLSKEQREYEFLQLSLEERYREFCAKFPTYHGTIPQYQVAQYLGVTPVALSRLLNRKTKAK
ncbi:MAG: Crp/Fnr family transcriptional regulator [Bdellovibrionales bacterium]|nr:Crp/Fnr family transcriptional regulator [Bdellovibrionales bacterium]